ncbi:predicted protein [Sclerotinia sclerotiorum 1980 UF-70]|uniref:Uncharacterized protein n=1 Tax=Sclerotinia sclerotiorum (strain ATCC 18683 / 1980 / Ss-1) TaxID=665079 RepID=A7EMN8_SCLS1|nr:predicted protein [Sclerotinia sclerotiorum 1980 UF-70]EDO04104.1 predicted protein [Sclerotinia sclerotiorum 1980 UF-70]
MSEVSQLAMIIRLHVQEMQERSVKVARPSFQSFLGKYLVMIFWVHRWRLNAPLLSYITEEEGFLQFEDRRFKDKSSTLLSGHLLRQKL